MPICFNREGTSCLGTNCLGGELSSQSNSGRVVEDELSGGDLTKCRICKLTSKMWFNLGSLDSKPSELSAIEPFSAHIWRIELN